jgi:hypothetical protein
MTKCKIFLVKKILLLIILIVFTGLFDLRGQCIPQVRRYASRQHNFSIDILGLGGNVSNELATIDGNPKNSSSLTFTVGALGLTYAEQVVDFNPTSSATTNTNTPTFAPGKPITVKLSLPAGLVGVGTGIEVQAISNLRNAGGLTGWTYTSVGNLYSGPTLLSLLNGAGDTEITITPNVSYQGIRVRLTSTLGLLATTGFFHAYILEDAPLNSTCYESIDVLAGVRAGNLASIATATGEVTNKWDAIDADPINTYADLKLGAQVLSEVFLTTVFKTLAQPGDAVQMIIQKPEGGLLDLNLLNGLSVRMYNGANAAGSAFSATTGLSLSLLPGSTTGNEKYKITIQVPKTAGAFDRVELKMGGLATVGLTPGIRIYDVKHIISPKIAINGTDALSLSLCSGNTAALSVSELQDCTTYAWFKTAIGGTAVHTGTSPYTPLASSLVLGQNIFYVEASRTNCTETSGRIPVTLNVNSLPTATISGTASVCQSAPTPSVTFTGANGTGPYVFTYTINGGSNQSITTTIGASVSLPVPNAIPGVYKYSLVSVKDNGGNQCSQAQTTFATVTITAKPTPPILTINAHN